MKSLLSVAFAAAVAAFVALAVASSAFADECKKYDYTAPPGVTLMTGEEITAALKGNTLDAWRNNTVNTYLLWFSPDGDLFVRINGRFSTTKWSVCGNVLVSGEYQHRRERLVAADGDKVSLFDLKGELVGTFSVIKGKSREF